MQSGIQAYSCLPQRGKTFIANSCYRKLVLPPSMPRPQPVKIPPGNPVGARNGAIFVFIHDHQPQHGCRCSAGLLGQWLGGMEDGAGAGADAGWDQTAEPGAC